MRLFLIRHGETEHNVAGLLAGVTDSLLTNHGLIQAQRLGSHLIKNRRLHFSQVFSSDLKRAFRTANEICLAQNIEHADLQIAPIQLTLLRERDFGSFELLPWNRSKEAREKDPSSNDPDFKPKETAAATKVRADSFLDDCLLPLLALDDESEQVIAIVSHGLFLAALWRALLLRFRPLSVSLHPEAVSPGLRKPLEFLPFWSNTGYLELSVKVPLSPTNDQSTTEHCINTTQSSPLLDADMKVIAVNKKDHLSNLKRTRGGLGSSTSDDKQLRMDRFFKKSKIDRTPSGPTSDTAASAPQLSKKHKECSPESIA